MNASVFLDREIILKNYGKRPGGHENLKVSLFRFLIDTPYKFNEKKIDIFT